MQHVLMIACQQLQASTGCATKGFAKVAVQNLADFQDVIWSACHQCLILMASM